MANPTPSPQIPHHVAALLSHLTSRPGVQSTFILSRKDGSIIQSTGLLASSSSSSSPAPKRSRNETISTAPAGAGPDDPALNTASPVASASTTTTTQVLSTSTPTTPPKPYRPSQAEALAAQIFAFVTSASNLSSSLSHPFTYENATGSTSSSSTASATIPDSTVGNGVETEGDSGLEKEDDEEVKLLRLRTKKHEIVVVPDKKFLLCVVHDATTHSVVNPAVGGPSGRFASR